MPDKDASILMWAVGILLGALQVAWMFIINGMTVKIKDAQKDITECYKRNDSHFTPRNECLREHEGVNNSLKEIKALVQKVFDEVKMKEDKH